MPLQQRSLLEQELTELKNNLLSMGSMVDTAIERAMLALNNRDIALAEQVIAEDNEVNRLRYEIEEDALRALATQQPMAGDLRGIVAAIHLAVELERIGDHATGIARLVTRMEGEDEIDTLHKLPKMAKRARQMVQIGLTAYVQRDADTAREMIRRDDKIDKQYSKLFRETLEEMRDDDYIRRATYLLWVGHNLERIGDRATNIAERVIFMITNEFVELMDEID
ncbi:MAG: phosphate signaling complex protein PhoU [Chloroflexi bacterium]|nr:phosphate signaling complex protein PhoU [Chloroflexota bacterium]